MSKDSFKVIGLMSGTSLDGIDLALVTFQFVNGIWTYQCLEAETMAYSNGWKKQLKNLVSLSIEELKKLDEEYTSFLAQIISDFIEEYNIENLDAICSHGHTALHQPERGLTYQIGNLSILSSLLNLTVVCDFRVEDVILGGQGAPLVPIGDKLLFGNYSYCLNLGGFANVSTENNGLRIAYDICPVNIVMNHYVSKLGLDYDESGLIAKSGILHDGLLSELNLIQFYSEKPPKSLGLEWVKKEVLPVIDKYGLTVEDVLRTFVEHVSIQISSSLRGIDMGKVLVTGGGAHNDFLIQKLQEKTSLKLIIPEKSLIDYKEAIVFGLLGVLKLRGEINCLKSVTGASKNHSSGKIYYP